MKRSALLALFIAFGCTAATQQPAAAPAATETHRFHNLQFFPKDIPREQLIATMRGFTRSLGVRCDYCHVSATVNGKDELDFPSDAKDEKRNARTMLRMAHAINTDWLSRLPADHGDEPPHVTCWTCHRGKSHPEEPPPAPVEAPHS